jgi:hypothetical protein
MLWFYSCGTEYKVFINGVYDHGYSADDRTYYTRSFNDTCYLYGVDEAIPDSSVFIQDIKIKYPGEPIINNSCSPMSGLVERLKDEAETVHANVVKMTEAGEIKKFPYGRYRLNAGLYRLGGRNLALLKHTRDSLKIIANDFCVVHIKNYWREGFYKTTMPVFFNDVLIHTLKKPVKNHGSWKIDSADLRLDQPGMLSIRIGGRAIRVEKGQEYYLSITGTYKYNHPYIYLQTRFDYDMPPKP